MPPRPAWSCSAFPLPATGPRSARLHDRCLSALLQRLLAALHQGMDRVCRRRRLGAQVEEKFCLCQGRLGIAVHIQLQARQLEVRLGGPRRKRDCPGQRLFCGLPLVRRGQRLPVRQRRSIGSGIELEGLLDRLQRGTELTALVEGTTESELGARRVPIHLDRRAQGLDLRGRLPGSAGDRSFQQQRVGDGGIRLRRASSENPGNARLTLRKLRSRHRAERTGVVRRLGEHGLHRRLRRRGISEGQLDDRLQHAGKWRVPQRYACKRYALARGRRITARRGQRRGPGRRLICERAIAGGGSGAIGLLGLDAAPRAIECHAEVEVRRGRGRRLRHDPELVDGLVGREACRGGERLAQEPLAALAFYRARIHHLRRVHDRLGPEAELRALHGFDGELVEQRHHPLRAGARHAELARLRLRALQRLARLGLERLRALGERRAVELALLAVQPRRIRAGGDRLTEQHLRLTELRQGANRRFRLAHGHGLLGPLLHALQQGNLPVQRRPQRRPDLLPAKAVEAGGAQGKVRLRRSGEGLRGELLASLGAERLEDTLQLRPASLGVSGLLCARVEPRRLPPGCHLQSGLFLRGPRDGSHFARRPHRLAHPGPELGQREPPLVQILGPGPQLQRERAVQERLPELSAGFPEHRRIMKRALRLRLVVDRPLGGDALRLGPTRSRPGLLLLVARRVSLEQGSARGTSADPGCSFQTRARAVSASSRRPTRDRAAAAPKSALSASRPRGWVATNASSASAFLASGATASASAYALCSSIRFKSCTSVPCAVSRLSSRNRSAQRWTPSQLPRMFSMASTRLAANSDSSCSGCASAIQERCFCAAWYSPETYSRRPTLKATSTACGPSGSASRYRRHAPASLFSSAVSGRWAGRSPVFFCSEAPCSRASLRESTALQAAFCSQRPGFFAAASLLTIPSYWSAASAFRPRE